MYFNAIIIDQDLTFNEDGVSFILMGTSSICFDMLIIDDEENDRNDYLYFNLYFYNGSLTQLIEIEVFDNEKGQFRESFQHETYAIHVCKFIDCNCFASLF